MPDAVRESLSAKSPIQNRGQKWEEDDVRVGIVAILMATAVCLTVPVARAQADCAAWKSRDFFATASAADVRACLRAGADPGAQNGYGETPLHRAAGSGHAEAIGVLIKGGADRNALAEHGYTPLHIIAMEGDTATIAAPTPLRRTMRASCHCIWPRTIRRSSTPFWTSDNQRHRTGTKGKRA